MRSLLVATRSGHKLREIQQILRPLLPLRLLDLDDAAIPADPAEDEIEVFDSFAANARAKAEYFAARSGVPVLADDSGLCVGALAGAPGVRSKRFSGRADLNGSDLDQANNDKLLRSLEGVPPAQRTAHYLCAVALVHQGSARIFEGRCDGVILSEPRGEGGFGYDPLFLLPADDATFGELSEARKNLLSHRAAALRLAAPHLQELLSAR